LDHTPVLTRTAIDSLLSYLDSFQEPDREVGSFINGYLCESEEVAAFRRELNECGFLLVFDWHAWLNENEIYKDIAQNIDEQIQNADIDTLRKVMTCYVRGDRFNEGLFVSVIQNGIVAKILQRIQQLAAQWPS
jgi:Family of unknown function (DUF6508)